MEVIDQTDFIKDVREHCTDMENDIASLSKGCQFWKVRTDTGWYLRRFWLDMDRLCLRYVPSQKPFWNSTPTYVDLSTITEVRQWSQSFLAEILKKGYSKKQLDSPLNSRICFTIAFGKGEYNLVAPDEATCDFWRTTLQKLVSIVRAIQHENQYLIWLKQQFSKADKERTGVLSFKQVQELLERINIKPSRKYAKELFNTANVDKKTRNGKQVLDKREFVHFVRLLTKRSELEEIFQAYAKTDSATMTAKELQMFLSHKQFLTVDTEQAKALILKHECSSVKQEELLTIAGFSSLLKSFDIANKDHREIFQDMTYPLTAYYISSSHNTYLSGNQLTSKSSVQMYISALEQGCRCVEMDLWDGPNGDPFIYHGRTLTSQIALKDVLNDAIKPYAFKASRYPLILSLECHLSAKQKKRLAFLLKDILGELLYTTPIDDSDEFLPSPEELKGRIIIKAKKSSEISDGDSEANESSDDEEKNSSSDSEREPRPINNNKDKALLTSASVKEVFKYVTMSVEASFDKQIKPKESSLLTNENSNTGTETELLADHPGENVELVYDVKDADVTSRKGSNTENNLLLPGTQGKCTQIEQTSRRASVKENKQEFEEGQPETNVTNKMVHKIKDETTDGIEESVSLSDLVNICQGIKFSGFHQNVKTSKYYHISSLSEKKAKMLKRKDRLGFIHHANNQLVRIYPKGSRTDSSNYNPVPFWNVGCQVVALNYQTSGLYKAINDAVFQVNGNCGYVLKPAVLRNPEKGETGEAGTEMSKSRGLIVRLQIISGQNLPKINGEKKVIDPYVKVKILGHPADQTKFKTKHVDDNGFNPIWKETTEFKLNVPELDIFVFSVLDKDKISDDDLIGYHILTVKSLRPGYGYISLTSPEGTLLPTATLFVHVSISDFQAS